MITASTRLCLLAVLSAALLPWFALTPAWAQAPSATVSWSRALDQERGWYASAEAVRIADNVLLYQHENGGWAKNIDMARVLGESDRARVLQEKERGGTTFDNGATHTQIRYLAKVHEATGHERFREGVLRGIDFALEAQYANGGWPQYYPLRTGYYEHITFNDGAMIGVMRVLRDVAHGADPFAFVDATRRERAAAAVAKGLDVVLTTQVEVDGRRTAWCAQYDRTELKCAKARAYELPSLSGGESVGIVRYLMEIEDPGPEVRRAVESAVRWLDEVKLTGIAVVDKPDPDLPRGYDRVVVADPSAPPLWARFYEIGTNRPMFVGRDGIVRGSLEEIEHERRVGYSYLGAWARELLESEYSAWKRTVDANGRTPAFPGAEGYGKYTRGGRGGAVYEVTNLNDAGPGSLRAGVEASGPRTVVFRVSGTIALESPLTIENPYITIAGQTAPGDGIAIKDFPLNIDADEVIVRYLRVRLGDKRPNDTDAVSARYVKNLILDHVSASWSIDETVSIYHADSVTVQWSLVSESLYETHHEKGAHGFGGIWGANHSTYHHNLLAHHSSRNPRLASGCGYTDIRNNVIYNWGYNSTYGGEKQQVGNPRFNFCEVNLVANYYKPGPATEPGEVMHRIVAPWSRDGAADYGKWYIADNVMHGNEAVTADNWNGGVHPVDGPSMIPVLRLAEPFPSMPIPAQSAEEAYHSVLENVGATLPRRDPLDERIVEETRGGYATYEGKGYEEREVVDRSLKSGIIDSQADVGGWPELRSAPAPADTDHDGMPDSWEIERGLDPNDAADRNRVAADGYTMLEKYLNGIELEIPIRDVRIPPPSTAEPRCD